MLLLLACCAASVALQMRGSERHEQEVIQRLRKDLRPAVYQRLAARGLVRASEERLLGLFPTTRWPAVTSLR